MSKIGHYLMYIGFMLLCLFLIDYGYKQVDSLKEFNQNAIETTGVIHYVSVGHDSINISYTINGERYWSSLHVQEDEKLKEGQEIKIYYSKKNPKDIKTKLVSPTTGYFVMVFAFFFEILLIFRFYQTVKMDLRGNAL